MDGNASFGYWVRRRRKALDLTQAELARRVGCAETTVRKIEGDIRRPSRQIAERLAECLAIPPADRAGFIKAARAEVAVDRLAQPAQLANGGSRNHLAVVSSPPSIRWSTDHQPRLTETVILGQRLDQYRTNLPAQPTSFIGRAREVRLVVNLMLRANVRLVTLTGPGGTGKTRLGVEAAAELSYHFADGVYFVDLAPISDPSLVAATIAKTLGVKESSDQSPQERLKAYLGEKRLLLLLDNFEQVVDAAPLIAELLAAAPRLKVLVTSRAVLHLSGEHNVLVPPLTLPERKPLPPLDQLIEYEAIQLFIQRAQAVRLDYQMTDEQAPAVVEICYRLDGLPLAIELAAARSNLFTPQALLARLDNRLKLLTSGPRDLPARQQTLRNTLAWSYDLLSSGEQILFARLGAFVSGWTLEAAEAICNAGGDLPFDVVDGLTALLDNRMIRHLEAAQEEPRFGIHETIREYALERLEESGEIEAVRQRHAEYYLALAEVAEPHLRGPGQIAWLQRLEREHDNFEAALGWSLNRGAGEMAARLAVALDQFWSVRHVSEARRWFEEILSRAHLMSPTSLRAKALLAAGRVSGSYAVQRTRFEESLAISRALQDRRGMAHALRFLGTVTVRQGDWERALPLYEESQAIYHDLGDKAGIASTLIDQAHVAFLHGEHERWAALNNESAAMRRELGDKEGLAACLVNLGEWARLQGDYARAQGCYEESLNLYQELGNRGGTAADLINIGFVALHQGDYERAAARFRESLVLSWELEEKDLIASCLGGLAAVAAAHGRSTQAARLSGAMDAIFARIGEQVTLHIARAELDAIDRAEYERAITPACAELGEAAWAAAYAEGWSMPLEQAVVEAIE